MPKYIVSIILCVLLVCAWADVPPIPNQVKDGYVPGELLLFVPDTDKAKSANASRLLETWGYIDSNSEVAFGNCKLKRFQVAEKGTAKNIVEAVRFFNDSLVQNLGKIRLFPNYIFTVCETNDPCFNRVDAYKDVEGVSHDILLQWDMNNTGECNGIPGADLNAVAAWELIPDNEIITVAVIDTGVDIDHPGLAGRILFQNGEPFGKDFTVRNEEGYFYDDHGHGSHCAGSIAAAYNDAEGITGSSGPTNIKILPVKALKASGAGNLFQIMRAIRWAAEYSDVLSMSFGAVAIIPLQEPLLRWMFNFVFKSPAMEGTIPVGAAGNNGEDLHAFPAYCDKVIAIAASDNQDKRAYFSNYGDWVDVASPGVNILSVRAKFNGVYLDMYRDAGPEYALTEYAVGNSPDDPYDERGYYIASGTSMACPNAAGVVAMLLAVNPNLKGDIETVRQILMETSDLKGMFDIKADGGRINALKAIQMAQALLQSK